MNTSEFATRNDESIAGANGTARLLQVIGDLGRDLATKPDLDVTLTAITAAAVTAVPAANFAGIIRADGHDRAVARAGTDAVVDELDSLQTNLRDGPGIAALQQQRRTSISKVNDEHRWPDFTAAAARLGIASVLSLQLFIENEILGALNLYATTSHAFTADDEITAEVFTTHACIALRNADERQQLTRAIASRDTIGQAKGILMMRHHVTAGRAFEMLVDVSQHTNIKLVDVAHWVVDENLHQPQNSPDQSPKNAA